MEEFDLVIIGAGWSGLAMAKTYLQVHNRGCSMLVLDSASTIGGTWASERLYMGLKTNSVVGSYEYSDFPMDRVRYSLQNSKHIPGHVVQQYLVDFANHFGISNKIRLRTHVESVTMNEDDSTWQIDYRTQVNDIHGGHGGADVKGSLVARKLVVATGLTSQPHMPSYPGQAEFQGHILHAKQLRARATDLTEAKDNVIVVGANKSAWDVCHTATHRTNAMVHMLIRPSGRGPTWIWRKIPGIRAFTISRLSSTRLFSWVDQCSLAAPSQQWFQRTWLGRLFCAIFWAFLDQCLLLAAGYYSTGTFASENRDALEKLRPWFSSFWMGNAQSNDNYEMAWLRKGRLQVHHCEIETMLPGKDQSVSLSDGQLLHHVDVVVACTGWDYAPSFSFGPPSITRHLGLPSNRHEEEERHDSVYEARRCIEHLWPALSSPPERANRGKTPSPPYRLYRFVVPPAAKMLDRRNIAFIGFHQTIHTAFVAQAQALWIAAFFRGSIKSLDDTRGTKEWTYLHTEYQKLRRLGSPFPDLVTDTIPYVDLLLQDVGVSPQRKKKKGGSWFSELVSQYTPADYRGLVDEWMENNETSLKRESSM